MDLAQLYSKEPTRNGTAQERSIRVVHALPAFAGMKAAIKERRLQELNYAATDPSQFRRTRNNLGGTGDAHYAQEFRYWNMREYARDMDRNDIFVGQLFTRACDNILGSGLMPHPATGDDGLNAEIRERWKEWAQDPKRCDYSQRHPFWKVEQFNARTAMVDGDAFDIVRASKGPDGDEVCLQYHEGDKVASPDNQNDDIVHGIEIDYVTDRVLGYHFLVPKPGQRKQRIRRIPTQVAQNQTIVIPAFDKDTGWPNVLHVFDPERMTQNRGVTVLHACFDAIGMFEDINYARLVQQQVVSSIAAFITSEKNFQFGAQTEETQADASDRVSEEIIPGAMVRLRPGEKVAPFTSGVPGPEFQQHVRLILRLVGGCIGMPLELSMMDTSDTTFHGYRGVLQMARRGFIRQHLALTSRLHRPTYERLVSSWFPGRTGRQERLLLKHEWQVPGFPYVDPKVEAEADKVRSKNLLTSPRRLHAEQGNNWEDVSKEIVEDYSSAIKMAVKKAKELNTGNDDEDRVTWRDVLNLDAPAGVTRQVKEQFADPPPGAAPAGGKPAPKKAP